MSGPGCRLTEIPRAFQQGVGDTLGFIAMVIGLGTVIGKLLAESGGAVVVSSALIRALGERRLDWALMLSGFIVGLPVFFQVGLVLLAPVLFTLTRQDRHPGNSPYGSVFRSLPVCPAAHGLTPPHPGPLAAIERLGADIGRTLFYWLIVALPVAMVIGSVLRAVHQPSACRVEAGRHGGSTRRARTTATRASVTRRDARRRF